MDVELTILMPCLNEAETLAVCIRKARKFLADSGVVGEVLIADNGSDDGSQAIAAEEGARLVDAPEKGYGAALIIGIREARGQYVIMGDADDSYDFANLMPFVAALRGGGDIVMGNRFLGGITPGAMPFLHRYLGNPVLSFLGRLFFSVKVGDFHCGLRGFRRDRILALNLQTLGMEFASEMVVKASLSGYNIVEVPTTLQPDGRTRAPHLRTWRDGWRHLRFLLIHTPRWLFFYPGLFFLLLGALGAAILSTGGIELGAIGLDIHTFLASCMMIVLGMQLLCFGLVSRQFAVNSGFIPPPNYFQKALAALSIEKLLIGAAVMIVAAALGFLFCLFAWARAGFGPLQYGSLAHALMLSLTIGCCGVQLVFESFLLAIMDNGLRNQRK
ncbi:MAG: glycosyltransferase family 2 protein [Desulfobulbaceae bacterium]|jgi:glycosyltransferase involved in cell wall biosynthesis|nr:glycosyltransferase family 2 protein [Desulfobulbaceae bacterium]